MELPGYFRYATNISTDTIETLPPMGLLYIIGNSKHEIDFIDNRIKKYGFEELCEILMRYDIVGFGGTIFEIKEARRLSAHLLRNGKTTFYGGPNATVNWRLYLGYFSIIWRGEAELMFGQLTRAVADRRGLNEVPNIIWRHRDGHFVSNPRSQTRVDMNRLPLPPKEILTACLWRWMMCPI